MADIFFSYKREDRHRVQLYCLELQKLGFEVAWDQEILTGVAWENWILDQLIASKVVLVFWSHYFVESEYVKKEARLAYNAKKLLPVYIDRLTAIEKARLMGFDGLQFTELFNWKGNLEDPTWLALITAIERAITPTYVERKIARKNDELYTARLLRDTVVERETTFEKQIVEAEQARLEATTRERRAALELIEATNKLSETAAKVTELEASAAVAGKQAAAAEASRKEARDALDEKSVTLLQTSKELAEEKALRAHQQQFPPRSGLRFLSVAPIAVIAVATGAISMWGAQSMYVSESRPLREGQRALVACEALANSNDQTAMPTAELQRRLGACKTALADWIRQVDQSPKPVIASVGTVHPQRDGSSISDWEANNAKTWKRELANSGLPLVADLDKLKGVEREKADLARRLSDAIGGLERTKGVEKENSELNRRLKDAVADLGKQKTLEKNATETIGRLQKDNEHLRERVRRADAAAADQSDARAKTDIGETCDRLAGDPFDPQQVAAKRQMQQFDALELAVEPAIRACEEASRSAADPRFKYQLGRALLAGKDKKALDALEAARRSRYAAGSTLLGWIYREGALGEKNLQKALQYYAESVALKDPAAMVQLAYMYRREEFGMKDEAKALSLYQKAADLRYPSAIMSLGEFYRDGTVVEQDCDKAIKLFSEAARLGNTKAAENLANARKACG